MKNNRPPQKQVNRLSNYSSTCQEMFKSFSIQPIRNIEHVLICKKLLIEKIMGTRHLVPITEAFEKMLADPSAFWFGPRNVIEKNKNYVQFVAYVLIKYKEQFLCYQRSKHSSEQRLKNQYSIGFGGHISLKDARLTNATLDIKRTIEAGAIREVREELNIETHVIKRKLSLLHSRYNVVDTVHCGLVEIWDIEAPDVKVNDSSLNLIGFKSLTELSVLVDLETWSKLLVQNLSNMNLYV